MHAARNRRQRRQNDSDDVRVSKAGTLGWARHRPILLATGLCVLVLLVYSPAMDGEFVFDDTLYFDLNTTSTEQPHIIRADDGLKAIWFSTRMPDYWPLTNTMFWIEWRLWGENPTGYHIVNMLLHALSAMVIWRVLKRLAVPGALLAAAIFAIHPVTVASVAWISEMKNTLSLLLVSLSVLAYLRFEDNRRSRWYAATLGTFLMALLAKTSVVMMPPVLLVLAWWRRGRIGKADLLGTLPMFGLSLVMGLVTVYYQNLNVIDTVEARPEGMLSRLAATGWCIGFYIYKTLVPVHLSVIYSRWDVDPAHWVAWLPLLGLLAVAIVGWGYRAAWGRPVLVTLLTFVGVLLPVLGLVPIYFHTYSLVADHFQYVALVPLIALAVAAASTLRRHGQVMQRGVETMGVLILVVLSYLTWQKAHIYQSQLTLWNDTVKQNPLAWAAHNNLGSALQTTGNHEVAIGHYQRAVRLKSDYFMGRRNLGLALHAQGEHDAAIEHLRHALQIYPDSAETLYSLGSAHAASGKPGKAINHLQQTLKINPEYLPAYNHLGIILESQDRLEEAVEQYRMALKLDPDYPDAHSNLAIALETQGKITEAIHHYRRAVEITPQNPSLHTNLAKALEAQGRTDEAIKHFRIARQLSGKPDT